MKKNNIIIIIFVVILLMFISYQRVKYDRLQEKYKYEISLRNTLSDTIKTYKNKHDDIIYEKSIIQAELKDIKKLNGILTDNQKTLIKNIENLEKDKKLLIASNIDMSIRIDSLDSIISKGKIDTLSNSIYFQVNEKYIKYKIKIENVVQFDTTKFVLHSLRYLEIPNKQFISFTYDKKNKKPISFSIINDNPYLKINDMDSYMIPDINPNNIDDTFIKKAKTKIKNVSNYIKFGLVGIGGILIGTML